MASTLDFRFLDEGLGGAKKNKRKRAESEDAQGRDGDGDGDGGGGVPSSMDLDGGGPPPRKRAAVPSLEGRPTYDGVIAGRVSGRKWKQARAHRASAVAVSRRGKSLVLLRTIEKEAKRAYRERMDDLKEKIRQSKENKRKAREEREKRKQENILRSGTKLQKITNPKTLKKIAKSKDRKLLKVVPDELLSNNGNKKKKKNEDQ